ncbi:MAG: hypothetical protein LJE68_05970 [Rhodobacter sp.]|nr:hypothetical protein [Rhodobacter sp.]
MGILRFLSFALGMAMAGAVAQADECADLRRVLRVPDAVVKVPPGNPGAAVADCSIEETAMFQKNYNAIAHAQPPDDASRLYGTWLGDDVLMTIAGLAAPGQEVLKISAGAAPDSLQIRQYWIKAAFPEGQEFPWEDAAGYGGWVSAGTVFADGGPGRYRAEPYQDSFRYSGISFEFGRSDDLWVKSQVNHFEGGIGLALDGAALVLRSETRDPRTLQLAPRVTTYTRVAEGAPDLAILLVAMTELSQARTFECFTHQISDRAGPLIDAIAPLSPEDLRAMLSQRAQLHIKISSLRDKRPLDVPMSEADQATLQTLTEQMVAANEDPQYRAAMQAIFEGGDLGCPILP